MDSMRNEVSEAYQETLTEADNVPCVLNHVKTSPRESYNYDERVAPLDLCQVETFTSCSSDHTDTSTKLGENINREPEQSTSTEYLLKIYHQNEQENSNMYPSTCRPKSESSINIGETSHEFHNDLPKSYNTKLDSQECCENIKNFDDNNQDEICSHSSNLPCEENKRIDNANLNDVWNEDPKQSFKGHVSSKAIHPMEMFRNPFLPTVTLVVPMPFVGLSLQPSVENKRNLRVSARLLRFCAGQSGQDAKLKKHRWKSGWKMSLVGNNKSRRWPVAVGGVVALVLLLYCCWLTMWADVLENEWNKTSVKMDVTYHWSTWSPWSPCSSRSLEVFQTRSRHCLFDVSSSPIHGEDCSLGDSEDFETIECNLDQGNIERNETDILIPVTNKEPKLLEIVRKSMSNLTMFLTNVTLSASSEVKDGSISLSGITIEETTLCDANVASSSCSPLVSGITSPEKLRYCDQCTPSEVCIALPSEEVPTCRLQIDPTDVTGCGGHCRLGLESCHRLFHDAYRCLDDTMCFGNEFKCKNLLCIPEVKRCDGHMNCYDNTDEYDCPCNLQSHFQCGNNTSCLPLTKRCNRVIDCWDGADEANCTIACLGSDQFTCTDGQCISRTFFCDGVQDCLDGTDEPFGCGGPCFNSELGCDYRRCLPKELICDGKKDCLDGSDEMYCDSGQMKT